MSIYNSQLEDLPVGLPDGEELTTSSWHLYAIRVKNGESFSRRQLYNELHKKNIGVNVHYIPIYRQPYFADLNVDEDVSPGGDLLRVDPYASTTSGALRGAGGLDL